MKYTILVHRYAKALLDYAINNNMVDEVLDDFQLVKDTLSSSKELVAILNQPFVSKNRKINILTNLFKDKVQDVTLKFIVLMIEKNRVGIIVLMYDKYYELYLEYKKIGVVTITTAVELDDKTKERILNILKHKIIKKDTIEIKNVINKDIIGGFIVNYSDYQYDASVKATLKRLHYIFEEKLFVKGYYGLHD